MRRNLVYSIIFIFFYILVLTNTPAYCQQTPVKIKTALSKKIVLVGERFKYRISIRYPTGIEVKIPPAGDSIGNFDIKKASLKKSTFFKTGKIEATYLLNSFVVGTHQVPAVTINYRNSDHEKWNTLDSGALAVEVKDIIIEDAHEIKSIKNTVGFIYRYRYYVAAGLFIISFTALFLVYFLTKKIIKSRPQPVIYPDETALKQLNSAQSSFSRKDTGDKVFFIKITDILRGYIEKRYNINASKMTTRQFNEEIMRLGEISQANKEFMLGLLKTKDDIQFAQGALSQDELQAAAAFIKKFIETTKEQR